MVLLVYCASAALLLLLVHAYVCRLSRGAAAFLFLLPFVFVGHALIAGRVYAPIDKPYIAVPLSEVRLQHGIELHNPVTADIFSQMIPWRHAVRESVSRGEWPLWNPYILCGDILAAAAQPAPFSPFTLIALLLPAPISFTFTAAITFLIAAAGAFAFARELGCRELAASVAAIGWTYSAAIALYVLWPLGLCWALMPLVLLGTRRVVREPGLRSGALLMTAFALLLLAGHPESVLHIVALGAVYGAFELACVHRNPLRAVVTATAAGAIALLLCAIAILPNLQAVPQSAEYSFRQMWRQVDRSDSTDKVLVALATDVFPFLHVRAWVDPPVEGVKAESPAVGSIVLGLAIYALWRVRSKTTTFLGIATLFCLAAHAAWGPVMRTIHALPLFDITLNERLGFGAALFLATLAALGAEEIARRGDTRAAAITLTVLLIALGAGTVWITRTFVVAEGPVDWGTYKIFAELAGLGAVALLLAFRVPMRVALPACVALLLAQRTLSDGAVHASYPVEDAYPPMSIFEPLRKATGPFRISGTAWAMMPGSNALYGLEDVRGYEALTLRVFALTYPLWCVHQTVFFNRTDDLTRPMLSMMNVRFAFTDSGSGAPPGWHEVARYRKAVLLENENVIGRAFVPRTVKIGLPDEAALEEMKTATDFRERAWITADGPYERANGPGKVEVLRWGTSYELDAEMERDGWVVVSTSAWKGWRAYVDGRRVKLQRANVAFLGVYLTPGHHRVRLVYLPASFIAGRRISAATLLALGIFALWRGRRSGSRGS